MAKTAKVKKREISVHSRAARRGASPPSKDLAVKKTAAAKEESDYKPWLHSTQSGGVSKNKKAKQLTRQQKVRAQKALEKADAIAGKHETKVQDSKARSKRVQNRAKQWEDLNAEAEKALEANAGKKGVSKVVDGEWEDVEEDTDGAVNGGMEVEDVGQAELAVTDGVAGQAASDAAVHDDEIDEVT